MTQLMCIWLLIAQNDTNIIGHATIVKEIPLPASRGYLLEPGLEIRGGSSPRRHNSA